MSPPPAKQLTPMMQQYVNLKQQHSDCLLMFRLGDFYELFFEDAQVASRELELTLTARDCGLPQRAPMCGVPHHSVDGYIQRLVQKGYKVAICEQMEDPAAAKGLVRRDIVRIVTPGTVTDESMLEGRRNNFLAALVPGVDEVALAVTDASTGELYATRLQGEDWRVQIKGELAKYSPAELLVADQEDLSEDLRSFAVEMMGAAVSTVEGTANTFRSLAQSRFGADCFERQGVSATPVLWSAVGMLLCYLTETRRSSAIHLQELRYRPPKSFVGIDAATRRNLELTATLRGGKHRGTLIHVLDRTKSAMGGRTLVSWMEQPLMDRVSIERRLSAVETLVRGTPLRGTLQETLKGLSDLQRLITRVFYLTANARELRSIGESLAVIPKVKSLLETTKDPLLAELRDRMDALTDLRETLLSALKEELPLSVREGSVIADGFLPEIDHLRDLAGSRSKALIEMEARERSATGIKSLKITFNKVFGYYIEVTKANLSLVPERYIRKQTVAGGERYVTEELKVLEGELLTARERLAAIEYETFVALRDQVSAEADTILRSAAALASLDALCSLAQLATEGNYCRPAITEGDELSIKDGRHPVVEQLGSSRFVPNDTLLDCQGNRMVILTGPNMAGKSTYMRQVAIIVLMAQMGSFVPASEATIGLVDQIFTRVGASDDLAAGQSTFLVEMSETAHILKTATRRSLLIFDEIGRGTSTYDGMSIARAVIEYVADASVLGARTLFATHYHELTALEGQLPGVCNYYVAAKKRGEDVIFLRRILRGRADESYGIEVARLAGVPQAVIDRARTVLQGLESALPAAMPVLPTTVAADTADAPPPAPLPGEDKVRMSAALKLAEAVEALDVSTLTPLEALNLLDEMKRMLADG